MPSIRWQSPDVNELPLTRPEAVATMRVPPTMTAIEIDSEDCLMDGARTYAPASRAERIDP